MYIKEILKKDRKNQLSYTYHRLVESYRSASGPRQRTLLNLGTLELPKHEWKSLANRIEEITQGKENLFPVSQEVETLSQHYAVLLSEKMAKTSKIVSDARPEEYHDVDINSIKNEKVRSIGAEHVVHSYYEKIGINESLKEFGMSKKDRQLIEILIANRLISPGSEKHSYEWMLEQSGIVDLIRFQKEKTSLSSFYRVMDKLYVHKEELEKKLAEKQKDLFSLNENLILYDLTNTFFEGNKYDEKITFGRSKEKRSDCRLITLGMTIDEDGFIKKSEFFPGNVSEPSTLKEILGANKKDDKREGKPTVIMDAGIASEDNCKLIKELGYDYICVSRTKPKKDMKEEALIEIKSDKHNKVEARLLEENDETFLFCKSTARKKKEEAMLEKFRNKFEEGLNYITEGLTKKNGTKKYEKILERIGRLKERSHGIHQLYEIEVTKGEKGMCSGLSYTYLEKESILTRYEGTYYLRTTRKDLDESSLWHLYITLIGIEDSFRTLKDELSLRPIFHRKTERIEAHLFIALLAYQVLNGIRYTLREKGFTLRWKTLREKLGTHSIMTTSMMTRDKKKIVLRNCSEPEYQQQVYYEALNLTAHPIPPRRSIL